MNVSDLIDRYQLTAHPEGGYFREVYRSDQSVHACASDLKRDAVTHIYFLLVKGEVSRFHKVLHDEIWNFYEGDPLRLITIEEDISNEVLLGGVQGRYVSVVPGESYQAAESTGLYTLAGCTVAPGFEFADFSFLSDDPKSSDRVHSQFPEYQRFF